MIKKIMGFVLFYLLWVLGVMVLFFATITKTKDIAFPMISLFVAMGVPWIFFFLIFNRAPGWTKYVLENGTQASATLLSLKPNGVHMGFSSIGVIMRLNVQPSGESPFQATIERMMSTLNVPTIGQTYAVKYDPSNKAHVVLLSEEDIARGYGTNTGVLFPTSGLSLNSQANLFKSSAGDGISKQLAELAELHRNGDLSDAEFEAAKRKLLG